MQSKRAATFSRCGPVLSFLFFLFFFVLVFPTGIIQLVAQGQGGRNGGLHGFSLSRIAIINRCKGGHRGDIHQVPGQILTELDLEANTRLTRQQLTKGRELVVPLERQTLISGNLAIQLVLVGHARYNLKQTLPQITDVVPVLYSHFRLHQVFVVQGKPLTNENVIGQEIFTIRGTDRETR